MIKHFLRALTVKIPTFEVYSTSSLFTSIHDKYKCNVVSTNKRSQAEVFTVYFSLKYLECNNYNVHFTLTSLYVQPMSAGVDLHSHYTGRPELSSPY